VTGKGDPGKNRRENPDDGGGSRGDFYLLTITIKLLQALVQKSASFNNYICRRNIQIKGRKTSYHWLLNKQRYLTSLSR
jgi:hypothetical protein